MKKLAPKPLFTLTSVDLTSATWQKLERHLRERLASNRRRNDTDLDPAETAKLRGRNLEITHLLALNPDSGREDMAE